MKDNLGTRMKNFYESRSQTFLSRRTPVIIRIDGKAFHTFTKGMERPFDDILIQTMQQTAKVLCEQIQGCKLAYVQSDEISLLLTDWENLDTDAWFDYSIQKMTSVSASIATAAFNSWFPQFDSENLHFHKYGKALFDARVFSVPKEEVCNYFLWRQQDATRNSIQMVAQANFSHKELQGKNTNELQEILFTERGINFSNDLATHYKRGSCVIKKTYTISRDVPDSPEDVYIRNTWEIDKEIPIFSQDRNYIERLLN